jgi:hypothetical protein
MDQVLRQEILKNHKFILNQTNKNTKSAKNTKNTKNTKDKPKDKNDTKKDVKKSGKKKSNTKEEESGEEQVQYEQNESSGKRTWEDLRGKPKSTGPFTREEQNKVVESFCEYGYANQLSFAELESLVTETQRKTDNPVWPKIAECLPDRTVQSIHNLCKRIMDPDNYKGAWKEEEVQDLILKVKEYGRSWKKIGKEMNRTPTNVKDKYKQLSAENNESRIAGQNLICQLKLLKYIQESMMEKYSENPEVQELIKILKYEYKFSSSVEAKFLKPFILDEDEGKLKIDSSLKEEVSKVIIKNVLGILLNPEAIVRMIYELEEKIPWTLISSKLAVLSVDDCRNVWRDIKKIFNLEKKLEVKKDLKMINK